MEGVGSYGYDLDHSVGVSKCGPARSSARTCEPVEEDFPTIPMGLLGPTMRGFKAATAEAGEGEALADIQREPFIEGLGAFCEALDRIGGSMGSYLKQNVDKLGRSKAEASGPPEYRQWLLSELPVHAATGYRSYVEDSAFMANLWIGWTLEFFVEFFAEVHDGHDTMKSADLAYERSLAKHHNMAQRAAFNVARAKLPARQQLLEILQGGDSAGGAVDAMADVSEFVDRGRLLYAFCIRVNAELEATMEKERKAKR